MMRKELKVIGIYAAVTMILAVGMFSVKTAISEDANTPPPNKATIQGLETYAIVTPGEKPNTVDVTLHANNLSKEVKTLDCKLDLVRTDFTGNPLSRTESPADNKRTVERSQQVKIKLKAGGTGSMTWNWTIDARPGVAPVDISNIGVISSGNGPKNNLTAGDDVPIASASPVSIASVPTYTVEYNVPTLKADKTLNQISSGPMLSVRNVVTLAYFSANMIWDKK